MSLEALRPGQIVAEQGGQVHRDLFRWLGRLYDEVRHGCVPVGGIISAAFTDAQIDAWFDSTGLGIKGGPEEAWAVCNGANGTHDWRDRFVRHINHVTGSTGATGGSDSSAHTHTTPAHSHSGTGLFANVSIAAARIVTEQSAGAADYTYNRSATATGYARTDPDSGAEDDAAVVTGSTATDGGGTSGAASATDNKPAYITALAIMRVW